MFNSIESLKENGFEGFKSVNDLLQSKIKEVIPPEQGVYLVLFPLGSEVDYMDKNPAGIRGGRNPTVDIEVLRQNFVENTIVLYIGKAKRLSERIDCYLKHGQGNDKAAHWGGRMIWQLKDSQNLLFCWKKSDKIDSFEDERELINSFCKEFGRRPFANHTGGGKILKAFPKEICNQTILL